MNPGDSDRPVGADSLPTTSEIAPAELSAPVTNTEQFDKWLDQHSDSLADDPNRIYNPADPGDNGLRINVSKFVLVVIGLIFVLSAGSLGAYAAYNSLKGKPDSGQQGGPGNVQANILLDTSGRNLHINYDTTVANGRNFEATGDVLVQNQSAQAFKIQATGGSNIMVADTSNKTITIGDNPPGQVSLKVNGDITVNGALVSTDSGYSLSGQGLSIGGVLVCTANGCVSSSSPAPTPASPTIDVANLAYLNKTNNFTGINKFTAAGNIFVGDGSGLSALNAGSVSSGTLSDSRLSANVTKNNGNNTFSGSNTFNAQIQAAAGINSVTGYSINGTAGGSFSCAANQLLQQAVVSGGIITSGNCVTVAGGSTPTLQDVYDASAPASITLSGAGGAFDIQDAASPLATNLFQVGSNGDATLYFAVNNLGISVTGNVNTTGQYQVGGTQISSANLSNDSNLAKLNGNQSFSGNNTFSSASNSFSGNGSGLTNVNAAQLNGQAGSYYTNATNISTGTLSDSRLSNNVALLNALQTFTGANTFNNASNSFSGSGAGLTSLNASNVSSGTLNDLRLSSNVTLAGNTFNGASQLVQLTAGGILPVLNGSNLTALNASNISSGTLDDARLSGNVALLDANNVFLGNNSFHLNSAALAVQDAASPLAGNLFEVTDNTGSTKYFEVSAGGVKINGDDVCTAAGNCVGTGAGGAIGGSGTAGKIAKFTGTGYTIGDSLLSESGSVVAVGGSINIATGNTYQINGSQISSASLSNDSNLAKLDGTQTFTGANTFSNASNSFTGDGSGLSGVDAAKLNGQAGGYYTNATNISSGTLSDSRLSSNVALKNGDNTFTGNNIFSLNTAGLAVQDAASPLGTDLFEVTDSTGATKYFTVSATALQFNGQDVCTAAGNCTGVTGIGGSGTAGKLAKFTGTGTSVGDSLISDNGSTVTVGGVLAVNTITPTATLTIGTPTQTLTLQGDGSTSLSAKTGSFTNTLVFAAPAVASHTITLPNASGTVAVSASGPLSLDAAGNLTCPTCLTSGGGGGTAGVTSVNSLTGAITLAGTASQVIITPSGNTLTLSLPQDIDTTSSPDFANINVTGQYQVNGSQISSADLSDGSSLAKLGADQTYTGANTFNNAGNSFTGDGSGLTNLDADNIASGTLNDARLSSNVALLNRTGQIFTGDNTIKVNSSSAFQVQNATGGSLLSVDTNNGNIVLNGVNSAQTGAWTNQASNHLPGPRDAAATVTANGYVYEIGGTDDTSTVRDTVFYAKLNADGSTGTWATSANPLPAARADTSGFVSNGFVYVIGGVDTGFNSTNTVFYAKLNADGSTGTWTNQAANKLPAARGNVAVVAYNGYAYVLGGYDNANDTDTILYAKLNNDGSTGAWTNQAVNKLPTINELGMPLVANGYIYLFGGYNNNVFTPSNAVYYAKLTSDGSTGAWTSQASNLMSYGTIFGSAVVANGNAYIVAGTDNTFTVINKLEYAKLNADGSTGVWTAQATNFLPDNRTASESVISNGYIYAIGGDNASNVRQNTVFYAPTSRIQIAGSLDLVGLAGGTLTDGGSQSFGSLGGSITAGNITAVGDLAVQGQGSFRGNLVTKGDLTVANNGYFGGELVIGNSASVNAAQTIYPGFNASTAIDIEQTDTSVSGDQKSGIINYLTLNPVAAPTASTYLSDNEVQTKAGNSQNFGVINALYGQAMHFGSGNVTTLSGTDGYVFNESTGTVQNAIGGNFGAFDDGGGGSIQNAYGVQIQSGSGNVTNNYGLYVQDQSGAGSTLSYNIYSAGSSSKNFFAGSVEADGNTLVKKTSVTAFQVQSSAAAETLMTVDSSARSASGGNLIKVGNSTGTDANTTILVLDSTTAAPTSNLAALNGGLLYNSTTNHVNVIENGQVKELCNKTDLGCGSAGVATTLAGAYANGTTTSDSVLALDSTRGGVLVKDNSSPIGGTLFGVQSNTGTKYLDVTSAGISTTNLSVAAGGYISIAGGNTASRPGSPTEGMLYYDTTTKSLLVYANGKWQADRSSSTKIVAMGTATGCTGSSPSASLNPDGADYVVTSCTSAQTTINSAITALGAQGGTVYLEEGTYIIDGQINMASNVTLAGAGPGTILKLKDGINASINTIVSSSVSRVTFRDLKMDGNRANNTSGTQIGLYMNTVGSGSGTSAVPGYTVDNVTIQNFRSSGIYLNGSANSSITRDNIINNGGEGIHAQWPTSNVFLTINGNTVQGNSSYGIYSDISAITYSTISNNTLISNSNDGIYMNGSNNSIDSNTIYSNSGKGIELQNGNNTVTGNNVSSNTNDGIYTHGANNTISGNTAVSNSGFGIDTDNVSSNNSVSGNKVSGNASGGINLGGSTNQASANTVISNTNIGIKVTGSNNAVSGNTVSSNTTTGIYVNCCSSNNNIVSGNQVSSNASNGITVDASNGNQISNNRIYDNGGSGSSSSILVFANAFNTPDKNFIKDNVITDTAGTGYAIELSGGLKPTNTYLSGNSFSGTGATAILDTGTTGTTYINQSKTATSDYLYRFGADSATAFQVQNAGGSESLLSIDTTARSASGGNLIKVGNSTGTDTATTILVLDGATAAPTSNLGALNGGLFYNSTTNHVNVIENGVVKELCNKTDLGCGSSSTPTLSQVYGYGANTGDSTIALDSTRGGITIKDNSTPITGSLFSVQDNSSNKYLDVSSSKITVGENTVANAAATATTATTSGAGSNTTTVALTAVNSLANGDVIFIDNAGQDYFTRITAGGGTASLTVDPAVTYETGRNVTKYNVQYLGSDGANFSGATRNQNSFYQGYFLGGVVTGAGSTVYSDANIQSAGNLRINTTSGVNIQGTNSANAFQVQNAAGQQVLAVDTTTNSTKIAQGNLSISGLSIPQTPTLTTSSTGGTLAAATYYYQVAAVNANGSTPAVPSNPTSVTTSGATSQNTLTWTAVANASNYKIYRSTDGTNWKVNTVAPTLTSIIDNGTNYTWGTAGAIPTANTTGGNLTVSGTGTFQNSTDSTSAFQVQDSAGDSVLKIDTSNRHIGINNSGPTATLDVVASPPAPDFSFGFEDGTFGAFTPAGGWSIISGTAHTGSFSARDVSDQSSLTLTKSIASAGTISFYMIDNSGSTFKIDGVSQAITYNPSFTYFSFPISAGSHTFAWRPGTGGFEFLMYVDDVSITENAPTSYAALFNGGSVGIGTSAPAATLETDGTALFKTSNLSATDFQVQNGTGGNILSAGYGSLSTAVINDNMTTNTPTGTLKNSATYSAGNYVQLNPASGNTNGEIEYRPSLSGTGNWKANFEFFAGGGTGADSTFLYAYSNSTPTGEGSATGGYQIYFDEFTNTIALNFNGSDLATFSSGNIDNSTWHTAEVDKAGTNFKVYYDGTKIIDYTDISRTLAGPLWGFGARSGGSTDNHRVRNFVLSDNYFTGNQTNVNANSLFQAQTDNQYLFRIQNAAGTNILNSDSTNMQISLQSNLTLSDLSAPTLPGVAAGANTGGALSGAAGTTYYYKVTALSGKGESLSSSEVSINGQSFTKLSAPAAPTGVPAAGTEMGIGAYLYKLTVVTANGETTAGTESAAITTTSSNQEVTLTIPAVPTGATGYKVYRTVVGGASGTEKLITAGGCSGTVSATSCTDNATDAQANGSNPPASNTATTNLNNATVSWTSVSGATAYRVYRGTAAGAESAYQTAAGSPFTDTGAAGTTAAIPTRSTVAQLGIGTRAPAANLDVEGTALFKPAQDSTTAFQVQNASGNGLLSIGNNGAGSTTYINDNMTTNPPTGTLLNNATYSAGNYVQLNDGTSGVNGEVDYTPGISAMGSYAAQFDIWYSAGFLSGNSIYFYAGNSAVPTADTATNGGYIVDFDDHSLVAQLKYNNSVLASTSISLANSTWYTVKIVKAGTNIKVYFNGAKLIDFTDIGRAMPGTHWGLGAWSNPWSYIHRVRNFTLSQDNSINIVSVGNSGAGTTILQADNTPVDPSTGLSSLNGGIYYNSTTNKLMSIQNGQVQGFATSTSVTKVVAMGLASGCTGSSPVASADTVADYVVTSCTSAQTTINTAISALGAAGGTVYLKEGTYIIDGSINLANNVTLAGSGYGTILKLKDGINAGVNLISGSSVNRVGIRDMKLDGNKTNNTSGIQIAFKVNTVGSGASSSAVPGFKVNNVFAENFRNNAVSFSNSSANSSISNSTFLNNSSDAINGIATVTNLVINGNTLQGNGGNGIYLNGSDTGVTISGNLIEGNTSDGIFLGAGSTNKNNTVSGNSIINNGGHGFNAQSAIQLAVTSNNISSNTGDGIHLLAADKSSFSANTLAQNGSDGIDTNGGNYNSFSSNSIVSNTANGINMIIDNNSTISGNNISNNTSSGISIGVNGANNETISGNNISGNGSSGIVMQGSSTFTYQNSITGNTINANSSYGISLSNGPSYNTISDNKLYNNTGSGSNSSIDISAAITTLASDGNIISNNTINDTAGTGFAISLGGTGKPTNTYLSGNTFSGTGASSISDNGTNTIYANQVNANGDFVMEGQRGVAIGSLTASSSLSLQGALTTTALTTVAQPSVSKVGTAGTTTWGYKITALDGLGETAGSTEQTITTGNATLDGTNYNVITWTPVGGAINYKIYRTTAGGTPSSTGLIGTVAGNVTSFNDTGIAATTAAPTSNTSGGISVQGNATFKPTTDSTTAFQVQNSTGTNVLGVDSTNLRVSVGSIGTSTGQLYVSGKVPSAVLGSVSLSAADAVYTQGKFAYVTAQGTNLMYIYDVSNPASPVLQSSIGTGLNQPSAVFVQGKYAYVVTSFGNFVIFDVSNPHSPVSVGSTTNGLTNATSIYVQGRYAYVNSQSTSAFVVFDVSNPANIVKVGSIISGLNNPLGIYVQGRYAYLADYGNNSLDIIDVGNPASPTKVGSTTTNIQQPYDVYVVGRYAYVASYFNNKLAIVDVTDPTAPVGVTSIAAGTTPRAVYVQGRYAYLGTTDGVTLYDISNPASPVNSGTFTTSVGTSNGLMVQGRYVYLANQNNSQFQILDTGGAYAQQLEAGGVETGTLQVDANGSVAGDFNVQGGLSVGQSLQVNGNIGASGQALFQNAVNSSNQFQVQNASGGSLLNVDSTNGGAISLLGNASGETGAWKSSANTLSSARWGTTNVTANGYLYIIGGYDGASYLSTVNYAKLNADGSIGTIGSVNSLPAGAEYASSVFANGNIYVLGGFNGVATTNVYYAHVNSDGTLGSWATSATTFPIATGLYLHTSVTANGYVYMMGGYSSSGGNQNKVYYSKLNADGSLGAWATSGNNLTSAVQSAAAVTANGYVYVLGGSTTPLPTGNINSGYFAKLNMDGSISTWTAISLPINIGLESAVVNNGYVYLIGGENSAPAELSSVYFAKLNANGTIGGWTQSANSLFGGNTRWGTKAVSANGYIYEPAGNSGGAGTQTTYYVSTSRIQIGGNLDLVGLQGQTLADAGDSNTGSTGGSITAGNGTFVGALQVQGLASFAQSLSVGGNFSVNNVLYADSTNMTITLGQPSATPVLLVLGTKNTSGDPIGINGAMYYNTNTNKFRCFQNGAWADCVGGGSSLTMQNVYDNSASPATITTSSSSKGILLKAGSGFDSSGLMQVQNSAGGSLLNIDSQYSNIALLGNNDGQVAAWTTSGNALPGLTANSGEGTAVLNGYVYLINPSGASATVYYAKLNTDGSLNSWQTATSASVSPDNTSVAYYNGYVYAVGGDNGAGPQSNVSYARLNSDGTLSAWMSANSLPGGSEFGSAIAANGYLYLVGGISASPYYARINPDGSLGTWQTNSSSMAQVLYSGDVVVANGYIYAVGGNNGSTSQNVVYYGKLNSNGSISAFSSANTMPSILENASAVVSNGYLYVFGGDSSGTSTARTTVYYAKLNSNGSLGSWQTDTANPLPGVATQTQAVTVNGYVYVMGGYDAASTAKTTVYYSSTSRLSVGGNLDLVGAQGQSMADGGNASQGSTGGSITAGNITAVGDLQVQGQGSFAQGILVGGNLTVGGGAIFRNTANTTTAFNVQDAGGVSLFGIDTTNRVITFAGDTTTFANLTLSNAHFKSTQTTAPTSVISNCGTGTPTTTVTSGSTDSAGSFTMRSGTSTVNGTCQVDITFNKAYGAAPKAILVTGANVLSAKLIPAVTASSTTSFTVINTGTTTASTTYTYYYWVVE